MRAALRVQVQPGARKLRAIEQVQQLVAARRHDAGLQRGVRRVGQYRGGAGFVGAAGQVAGSRHIHQQHRLVDDGVVTVLAEAVAITGQ
ncbi:hypothetical protein G6F46_015354 [Rhizopus delemar]|nr:hypothetical protein G6F46_015354 [Rhizopus delemar]